MVVYDEVLDMEITVEYVCVCGLPVLKANVEGSFFCAHCDRFCPHGIMKCAYCAFAMQDRDVYEEEED